MSTSDWYARKMRSLEKSSQKEPISPLPPTPIRTDFDSPNPLYEQPITPTGVVPRGITNVYEPNVVSHPPATARTANPRSGLCPKCNSGNFGKSAHNVAPRCFDCGYVDGRDYHQETFTGTRSDVTQQTKQMPVQPYAPQQIVGRVE